MMSVFGDLITRAAAAEGVSVQQFNDGWVHKYTKGSTIRFSYGYQFDLNSGVGQQLATDKCAAYQLLQDANLSAVAHILITNWQQNSLGKWKRTMQSQASLQKIANNLIKKFGLPIVSKPVNGTGGQDVNKANTENQLLKHLSKILKSQNMVAVSPYISAETEFRLYILDGKCILAYQKLKTSKDWRFNLSGGATATIFTPEKSLVLDAKKAISTLGLRVGAVDFLLTKNGPIILEVNSGVMLNNFASQGLKQKELSVKIYCQILQKMFEI